MTSPAPESSTPKSKYWQDVDEDRNCTRCGEYVPPITESVERHECPPGFWKETKQMKRETPAPASCSEVVERLATECMTRKVYNAGSRAEVVTRVFDRTRAELILHEWRERRVQELEEALREMVKQHGVHSGECFSCDLFVREVGHHSIACPIPQAERLLAKSDEWREQIRKGVNPARRCSSDRPHPPHTFGGRPMEYCAGVE